MNMFLHNQDDQRLIRDHVTNTIPFQPGIIVQPPSIDQTTSNESAKIESRSSHSLSGYGSGLGLTSCGGTSYASEPSITTSVGIRKLPNFVRALTTDELGQITLQTHSLKTGYECPFDRLPCLRVSNSFESWYNHSLTHFQHHEPPSQNSCCFCPERFDEENGRDSWRIRLEHVEKHHNQGERLASSRFDTELYRYLWSKKLITDINYKDLTAGSTTRPRNHVGSGTHLNINNAFGRNRPRGT